MKLKNLKKRFVTLIEMMIVMFLIAMIMGVIAFNYTGGLEEGKAFKTKSGIEKIHTVLDLHMATNPGGNVSEWKNILANSPLVKNSDELSKDGWGQEYIVSSDNEGNIEIKSIKYDDYLKKGKGTLFKKDAK